MAVDICCIIENKWDLTDMINLPTLVDHRWKNLRPYIQRKSQSFLTPLTFYNLQKKAKWDHPEMMSDHLIEYWNYHESEGTSGSSPNCNNWFFCYFGMVQVWRHVIIINPFCQRFQAFDSPASIQSLVEIMKKIAGLFGTSQILYCADSATKTELLSNLPFLGKRFDEILEIGREQFGHPNPNYIEAFRETYFIDNGIIELI